MRVSVIMPAHNASAWITEALMSVLAQGDCVQEIIVVNDASTDDTAACVRASAVRDDRIRLLENAQQQGVAASRNRAIDAAVGEWIACVDADDVLLPGRVSGLLAVACAQGVDVVADNLAYFRDGSAATIRFLLPVSRLPATGMRMTTLLFMQGSPADRADGLGLLKPMLRRQFLVEKQIRFRESLRTSEDFVFCLDLLLAGANFHVIPAALYRYRVHPASTMARERDPERLDALVQVMGELAELAAKKGDAKAAVLMREWREQTATVQQPLLQLRARVLSGEHIGPVFSLLRHPLLWPAVMGRGMRWLRHRFLNASER